MDLALATGLDDANRDFRASLDALDRALAGPTPNLIDLGKRRVAMVRAASARLRFVNEWLCPTLLAGATAAHSNAARTVRELLGKLFAELNRQVATWNSKNIDANWQHYRRAERALVTQARTLLEIEQRDVYPLLASALRQRAA